MTDRLLVLLLIFPMLLMSCSGKRKKVSSGRIIYAIEYPENKDNFMLYSILPKEMKLDFNAGLVKCTIAKANLINQLFIDCNNRKMSAYFEFGADNFYVDLEKADVQDMLADQTLYDVRFTKETDTLAGFNVKKAIATAKNDKKDVIELWYTNEINIPHANWYNPFKAVPGFLLKYAIDRYGMRMEFTAELFEQADIAENELILKPKGNKRTYSDYNSELSDLFKTFE